MQLNDKVQHVYLVGAKSLGAYGGYETFVYKLTEYHQNKENIKYHVACKANGDGCMDESKFEGVTKINDHEFELHNAHCFKIDVPQIGPAQAIYYDVAALKTCCEHIKKNHIPHPIVYIMACRIGPFAAHFYKEIHKLGGTVFLNPDGHEWMRARWAAPIRKYWKISEQMMVKYCDLAICDSVNEAVHAMLAVLTDKQRDLIHQQFVLGKTHQEIADDMGISRGSVTRAVNQALERIRRKFDFEAHYELAAGGLT